MSLEPWMRVMVVVVVAASAAADARGHDRARSPQHTGLSITCNWIWQGACERELVPSGSPVFTPCTEVTEDEEVVCAEALCGIAGTVQESGAAGGAVLAHDADIISDEEIREPDAACVGEEMAGEADSVVEAPEVEDDAEVLSEDELPNDAVGNAGYSDDDDGFEEDEQEGEHEEA
jgi:hypothetical protein